MVGVVDIAYLLSCPIAALAGLKTNSRHSRPWWFAISLGVLSLELLRLAEASLWLDSYLQKSLHILAWYDQRRSLQVLAIVAFALALLIGLRSLRVGPDEFPLRGAIGAYYVLVVVVAIRLSSLHWTDAVLQRPVGTLSLSHAVQLMLLMLISGAALMDLAAKKPN